MVNAGVASGVTAAQNGHVNGDAQAEVPSQDGLKVTDFDGINGKQEGEGDEKAANLPPPEVAAGIPCRFFALGTCRYGNECAFQHQLPAGGSLEKAPSPASSVAATSSQGQGPSPPPMPVTSAVDFQGYPMAPAPPYFYYGMPQPFFPPMPAYPGYVDANGFPIPVMGQPFVDFTGQAATTTGGGVTMTAAAAQAGIPTSSATDGMESPRLMEAHPGFMEQMAALSLAQSQGLSAQAAAMSPYPLSPSLLPQGMQALPPAFHERRLSNSAYYGVAPPRPIGRSSISGSPARRSSTVGADPSVRTASAIISFPSSGATPSSPRSFGSHSRFSTEPGLRSSMSGSAAGKDKPPFPCAFFPENRCRNGDNCTFAHMLPSGQDARSLGKGMIGIDGRVAGPAEPSKGFIWPAGRGSGRGGLRSSRAGDGRNGAFGRSSFGPSSRSSFGAYSYKDMPDGNGADGKESARRYVDDEARERVERFIESTRSSGHRGGKTSPASGINQNGGMGQKVPSVGDFPALANDAVPTSPRVNGTTATNDALTDHHHYQNGGVSPPPQPLANKLASSFASAAARAVKATSAASSTISKTQPTSPAHETSALPAVPIGASA